MPEIKADGKKRNGKSREEQLAERRWNEENIFRNSCCAYDLIVKFATMEKKKTDSIVQKKEKRNKMAFGSQGIFDSYSQIVHKVSFAT